MRSRFVFLTAMIGCCVGCGFAGFMLGMTLSVDMHRQTCLDCTTVEKTSMLDSRENNSASHGFDDVRR